MEYGYFLAPIKSEGPDMKTSGPDVAVLYYETDRLLVSNYAFQE